MRGLRGLSPTVSVQGLARMSELIASLHLSLETERRPPPDRLRRPGSSSDPRARLHRWSAERFSPSAFRAPLCVEGEVTQRLAAP
jgi:hypothetical protein